MASLSALLESFQVSGDSFEIEVSEDWRQGRTIFGGASLALAGHAARMGFADLPPLRSVQASFVGAPSGKMRLSPKMISRGKSTAFVGVDIEAEGAVTLHAVFCYGRARESRLSYQSMPAPEAIAPEEGDALFPPPGNPDFSARFSTQFDVRRAGRNRIAGAADRPELLAWVRHRDQALTAKEAGVLALADLLPPSAMSMFSAIAPVSTLTWQANFLSDDIPVSGWKLLKAKGEWVGEGYCSQTLGMWDQAGRPLIAASQQVAVYY